MLLTLIGPTTFRTLWSLISLASVDDKTFEHLAEELERHYSPNPSEIVQHFKFNSRCLQPTETLKTFVSEFWALAKHCNYHINSLDSLLRDRLVCPIIDTQMQRKLHGGGRPDLRQSVKIGTSYGDCPKDRQTCSTLQQQHGDFEDEPKPSIRKLESTSRTPSTKQSGSRGQPCLHCGCVGHAPDYCRFRSVQCHHCGKTGHIVHVCQTKQEQDTRPCTCSS